MRPYVQTINRHTPKKIPSGPIHNRLGVGFVPNATIHNTLKVLRAYDCYKDVHHPGVIDFISRGFDGLKDFFS